MSLVLSLIVCGNIGFAQDKVEIDFYCLAWQPVVVERVKSLVEEYNMQNPHVKVNYIEGDWGGARDYFVTSLVGGAAPDVMHGLTSWPLEFGTMGFVEDLRSYIPKDMWEDIDERAWDSVEHPFLDAIFAIPWCWETQILIYNAERFGKQGISIPRGESLTWDEFNDLCKKVTSPPEHYAFATSFTVAQSVENIISFIWQSGEDIMYFDETEGKWVVSFGPEAKEALQWYHDLIYKYQAMPTDVFGLGGGDIFDAFGAGAYSMAMMGCWARSEGFAQDLPFEWGVMLLPHPQDGKPVNLNEPQSLFISKDGPYKEEAWKFVEYFTNTENMAALAAGDWLFPTRKSSLQLPPFHDEENYWDVCLKALEYGRPYVTHPGFDEFSDRILGPNMQAVLMNKLSIDEAAEAIVKGGNEILERYRVFEQK